MVKSNELLEETSSKNRVLEPIQQQQQYYQFQSTTISAV